MRQALHIVSSYLAWILLGGLLYVIPFQLNFFSGISILFYRGILNAVVISVFLFLVLCLLSARASGWSKWICPEFGVRDSFAISISALALNITFLIVFPVTIDRSVTVFLLGEMARHESAVTTSQLEDQFRDRYIGELQAVHRRMHEQIESGNVVQEGAGYKLSPQGERFIALSRWIAKLFRTDTSLISPPAK